MEQKIRALREQMEQSISRIDSKEKLAAFWQEFLSKKGSVAGLMKGLGAVAKEDRPAMGKLINDFKVLAEERYQALEPCGVVGANVGGLAETVLGVGDATDLAVHGLAAEAGVDDDGAADGLAGRLQKHQTAIGQISHDLHRGLVVRVLLEVQELAQHKVGGEANVIDHTRLMNGP